MERNIPAFQVKGEAYAAVHRYREETDLRVVRNQIERHGRAVVIRHRGEKRLHQITELPSMGEAVPWYGNVGTGYEFRIHPSPDGFELEVVSLASEQPLFCAEKIESLRLVPAPGFQPAELVSRPASALPYVDLEDLHKIIMQVPPDRLPLLEQWTAWGEPLGAYEYRFGPLTVGTSLTVHHIGTGASLNLTDTENW